MRRWLRLLFRRGRRGAESAQRAAAFDVQRDLVGRPDAVVFDVGAHVGSVARKYRERFPAALIHCFEPFPASLEELRRNLAGDGRVHAHALALAASTGEAQLHVNAFAPTNSLLASDVRGDGYWGPGLLDTRHTIPIRTTTLDAFCGAEGIEHIDVLKLDVQGAELAVLQGARRMLSEQRVGLAYLEIIFVPTYLGQPAFEDYLSLFTAHGYVLFALFDQVFRRGRLIQADALFVSPRLLADYEARTP